MITQQKLDLIRKIINARLTATELQAVTEKAKEQMFDDAPEFKRSLIQSVIQSNFAPVAFQNDTAGTIKNLSGNSGNHIPMHFHAVHTP